MHIIHKSIHIINYDIQQVISVSTPPSFDIYVAELINHIKDNSSIRDYKTRSNSKEVIGCILNICSNSSNNDLVAEKMYNIAKRLLEKEIEAQVQIRRINTSVQKGSLIQALLWNEDIGSYTYLLAKVEHTEWVDDADFSFKTGFSKDKKTLWKSCLFDLSDLDALNFLAKVYSNTKAQYWNDGFLELEEINSNERNTQLAFSAIDKELGYGFKGVVGPDKTIIRNAFIGYLKNNEFIDYEIMVNTVLLNYQIADDNLNPGQQLAMKERIQNIRLKLLEQPDKKKFDRQFLPVNSAINARIRKIYPVNEGIELKINNDIEDLKSTIKAVEEAGIRYIKIKTNNNDTYQQFRF